MEINTTVRNKMISLRCSQKEKDFITSLAKEKDSEVSSFLREIIFNDILNLQKKEGNSSQNLEEKINKVMKFSAKTFSLLLDVADKNNMTSEEIKKSVKGADNYLKNNVK